MLKQLIMDVKVRPALWRFRDYRESDAIVHELKKNSGTSQTILVTRARSVLDTLYCYKIWARHPTGDGFVETKVKSWLDRWRLNRLFKWHAKWLDGVVNTYTVELINK
jgi:hypothetical protein